MVPLAIVTMLRNNPPDAKIHVRTDSWYVAASFNSFGSVRSNLPRWRELAEFAARRPIKIE